MSNDRSRDALLDFLDYLANKGLMAKGTARARKAAASKVLGILSEDEAKDITLLDLDEVMSRFQNLEGKNYTPGSLATYRGRVRSALEDFGSYLKSPLAFRPSVRRRESAKQEDSNSNRDKRNQERVRPAEQQTTAPPLSNSIVPIPIRQDVIVHIQGLPLDLSETEAERIANVVRAMATPV